MISLVISTGILHADRPGAGIPLDISPGMYPGFLQVFVSFFSGGSSWNFSWDSSRGSSKDYTPKSSKDYYQDSSKEIPPGIVLEIHRENHPRIVSGSVFKNVSMFSSHDLFQDSN